MIYAVRTWRGKEFTDHWVEASSREYAIDKVIAQSDKMDRIDGAHPWNVDVPKGVNILR